MTSRPRKQAKVKAWAWKLASGKLVEIRTGISPDPRVWFPKLYGEGYVPVEIRELRPASRERRGK